MKLMLTLAVAGLVVAPLAAKTAQCRDAKGHFASCAKAGSTPLTPAAVLANNPAEVTKDAKGKCHFSAGPKKGQFTGCPKG